LGYGADVNLADKFGSTALSDAVLFGNAEAVKLLIVAGANVNAADSQKTTILDRAKKIGRADIVKLLEDAGAKAAETPTEIVPAADAEAKPDNKPATEEKPADPKP
jgi:ankyrin repeat protein